MTDNLTLSLQITLVGMGLVFAAIILLWLLMLALTAITAERKTKKASAAEGFDIKEQAAALAVATAIAEQSQGRVPRFPVPPTAIVSAWQLSTRTRQMNNGE
jgi:Na+-transporting methylmalonyl-CoA/oxaloacetate decarboxylase gamma subunit